MNISVTKAEYLKDYSIILNFNNGERGVVDLKSTIFNDHRKIFESLKEIDNFKKFSLDSWTIVWDNDLDLAPEYLYRLIKKQENS
jgi:uncharacterized protein YkvS